jgi:hypothetical protein
MPEFTIELEREGRIRQFAVVYVNAPTSKEAHLRAIEMSQSDIDWQDGELFDWGDTHVIDTYTQD